MRVIDTFIFNNELDALEIRLHELKDVADVHIIAEFPLTFQGKEKPLYFQKHSMDPRFSKFANKIVHLDMSVGDIKKVLGDFKVPNRTEKLQRKMILDLLRTMKATGKDDVIIHSDSDEIPSAAAIRQFISSGVDRSVIVTGLYRYFFNLYFQDWKHLFVVKGSVLKEVSCLDTFRKQTVNKWSRIRGGWHFSPVGNFDFILQKYQTFSCMGRAKGKPSLIHKDRIKERVERKLHPFRDDVPCGRIVPMDSMPSHIYDNKERFKEYLL